MIIRQVNLQQDALALVDGAHDLANRVHFRGLLPSEEHEFVELVGRTVTMPGMEVLVAEKRKRIVGVIGVLYSPYLWGPGKQVAEHRFLWASRDAPFRTAHRLVEAALAQIDERGAIPIFHMLSIGPSGLEKVYRRHGLEVSDSAFMRLAA